MRGLNFYLGSLKTFTDLGANTFARRDKSRLYNKNHKLSRDAHGDFLTLPILNVARAGDVSLSILKKPPLISVCELVTRRLTPLKRVKNGVKTLENGAKTRKSGIKVIQIRHVKMKSKIKT